MVHDLPDDWETQVTRAYQVFGVNNDTPIDQFGIADFIRGAQRYWTPGKRSAKAKKQLRHPETKQWVEERGNIPDTTTDPRGSLRRVEAARGKGKNKPPQVRTRRPSNTERVYGPKDRWNRLRARDPQLIERLKVERAERRAAKEPYRLMSFDEAEDALERTRTHPAMVQKLKHQYAITRDGNNFVVVPNAYQWYEAQEKAALYDAKHYGDQIAVADKLEREVTTIGRKLPDETKEMIRRVRAGHADAQERLAEARKRMGEVGRYDPPDQKMMNMAHEALDELEDAVERGVPQWRKTNPDGSPAAFGVELDASNFIGKPYVNGYTMVGEGLMAVNPAKFYDKPIEDNDTHFVEAPFENTGLQTINHELGHMVDGYGNWDAALRPDLMGKALATREGGEYSQEHIRETIAEAMALRQFQIMSGLPVSPYPQLIADVLGWDLDVRPDDPPWTGAWAPITPIENALVDLLAGELEKHQEGSPYWKVLSEAIEAFRTGRYDVYRDILKQLGLDA